jgi:hypothetical protein
MLGVQVKILGTTKNNIMGRLEFNAEIVFTDLNPDHEIELLDHMREVALEVRPLTNNNPTEPSANAPKPNPLANASERAKQIAQATKAEGDDEFEISEDFLE